MSKGNANQAPGCEEAGTPPRLCDHAGAGLLFPGHFFFREVKDLFVKDIFITKEKGPVERGKLKIGGGGGWRWNDPDPQI